LREFENFVLDGSGISRGIKERGVYEPKETAFIQRRIKKGWTVYNVGAHIGYYTVIFSHLVGDTGRVYAFEPEPHNFALLQKNTGKLKNVVLINKAISDRAGKTRLYFGGENTGDNRIYPFNRKDSVKVKTARLDEYKTPDFVKIDVQGAEVLVLKGMGKMRIRRMMIEFDPLHLQLAGSSSKEFFEMLKNCGIYDIRRGKIIRNIDINKTIDFYKKKGIHTNLWISR